MRRRRRELGRSPLVHVEQIGARQIVAAACERAAQSGVRPGMTLSHAGALCPGLVHVPHEPEQDRRALVALGRWLTRFTPSVTVAPPDGLLLDVTGCERLYGGLDALQAQVGRAMASLRLTASLATAPTPGAAWALAGFAGQSDPIVAMDQLIDALSPLPPAALRIDVETASRLNHLGIATIGQLLALPRPTLPARFGAALLHQLDAALGHVPEPLAPLQYEAPIEAEMEFEREVESLEAIWQVLAHLIGQLVPQLAQRGCGARLVRAEFKQLGAAPIVQTIRLSRPSRDPRILFNLLRCATESARSREGFLAVRLTVPALERVSDDQLTLHGQTEREAGEELARLIERLTARLGERSIIQPTLAESHLPERAYRLVDPLARQRTARGGALLFHDDDSAAPRAARPLCLLPEPQPVRVIASINPDGDGLPWTLTLGRTVHQLVHVDGPERICGVWWEGRHKTRDYFDAQDDAGRRFWLFRVIESGRWFLHGVFD